MSSLPKKWPQVAGALRQLNIVGDLCLLRSSHASKKRFLHHLSKKIQAPLSKLSSSQKISFSSTPGVRGCWINHSNQPIGFDIELKARIHSKLIYRICQKSELVFANHSQAHYIWVIKEAVFKALKNLDQPPTISQVQILSLTPLKAEGLQFTCRASQQTIQGLAFEDESFYFCIAQVDALL